jgi:hypothetical protein
LRTEESFNMLVRDFFNGNIFTQIHGEFVESVNVVFYGVLARVTCPNGEQLSLYGLRKGDLGHMRLQLRQILL